MDVCLHEAPSGTAGTGSGNGLPDAGMAYLIHTRFVCNMCKTSSATDSQTAQPRSIVGSGPSLTVLL